MKNRARQARLWLILSVGLVASSASPAAEPLPPSVNIVERGAHHRVVEHTRALPGPGGVLTLQRSRYTELGTGMHYWEEGWKEAREEIEILEGAAVAQRGQFRVVFAANLNSAGAIDLVGPEGQRFVSHVLGVAYTDMATGQSVLLAEVRDCVGAVVPPNQVLYVDALEGDLAGDVRYTYTRGSFEQDVILVRAPPAPAAYGLDPATTRLEVWTEFEEAPQPRRIRTTVVERETDPLLRAALLEPDLTDEELDFGSLTMVEGRAFPQEQSGHVEPIAIATGKSWERIEGRQFLIEGVRYAAIEEPLRALPPMAVLQPRPVHGPRPGQRLLARHLPGPPEGERGRWEAGRMAQAPVHRPGFVIDYLLLNSSQTNQVFQGDTTYYLMAGSSFMAPPPWKGVRC